MPRSQISREEKRGKNETKPGGKEPLVVTLREILGDENRKVHRTRVGHPEQTKGRPNSGIVR